MVKIKVGDHAPDIKLPASHGKPISLKDYKGKENIILYFYPKDDTPGCTIEACGFRDSKKKLEKRNAVVLGVSPDDVNKHQKFVQKFDLPFILLSDTEKKMCQKFGVWVEKNMYGRKYMGVSRTTFIINKDGKIAKIFEKVKPKGHEKEVLDALSNL